MFMRRFRSYFKGSVIFIVFWGFFLVISHHSGLSHYKSTVELEKNDVLESILEKKETVNNIILAAVSYISYKNEAIENLNNAQVMLDEYLATQDIEKLNPYHAEYDAQTSNLLALCSTYPKLYDSIYFTKLRENYMIAQKKVVLSITKYNSHAKRYNSSLEAFPLNIIRKLTDDVPLTYFSLK